MSKLNIDIEPPTKTRTSSSSSSTSTIKIGHNNNCNCHCQLPWNSIETWSNDFIDGDNEIFNNVDNNNEIENEIIFKINKNINKKIILWNCCSSSMTKLHVDAIVHPTNQRFERCTNKLTNAIYKKAGPELRKTLYNKIKYCPIGSIKITKGYLLNAHYIIHTASPHYKCKYHTASETSLYNCYLHVLRAAKHYNLRTLAIGNLALKEHNYPEIDGIHLGIRVIRRFLEKYSDSFDMILICLQNEYEYNLYRSTMKLYFPRNHCEELMQMKLLPNNNGGMMGEPIIPERAIRIKENPIKHLQEINDSGLDFDDSSDDMIVCHSYSSSFSNDTNNINANNSEINIDECRERLMELKYQEEFDDNNFNSSSLLSSSSTSSLFLLTSPMKRSSSFVSSFFNTTGNHHNNHYFSNENLSNYEQYSSMENMISPSSSSFNNHHFYHQSKTTETKTKTIKQNLHNFDDYDQHDQLMLIEHQKQLKFERLLRKVRRQEKDSFDSIRNCLQKCIYIANNNNDNDENVLIIIGKELTNKFYNELNENFDQIIVFIIKLLNKLCLNGKHYSILYFHTMVDNIDFINNNHNYNHNQNNNEKPKTQLLIRLYEFLSNQHILLLNNLYIIHPSIFNRLYVWWLKTFYYKFLKNKVKFIRNLRQLLSINSSSLSSLINENQLKNLPKFIIEYDRDNYDDEPKLSLIIQQLKQQQLSNNNDTTTISTTC